MSNFEDMPAGEAAEQQLSPCEQVTDVLEAMLDAEFSKEGRPCSQIRPDSEEGVNRWLEFKETPTAHRYHLQQDRAGSTVTYRLNNGDPAHYRSWAVTPSQDTVIVKMIGENGKEDEKPAPAEDIVFLTVEIPRIFAEAQRAELVEYPNPPRRVTGKVIGGYL